MTFTKIPLKTFQQMQLNAGILLSDFDPSAAPDDDTLLKNLLCATNGGIKVTPTPTFSDLGEDIDNCPKNTKELKHLDAWEIKISGTAVTMDPNFVKFCLASADVDDSGHITLRNDLNVETDFQDIWWVGDYNKGSGYVAVHMINALSTGGFSISTNDQDKATADFEFTGHYSIEKQDQVPIEFYIVENMAVATDTGDGTNETPQNVEGTEVSDSTEGGENDMANDGVGADIVSGEDDDE